MKITFFLSLLACLFILLAKPAHALPKGYCQVGCNGSSGVPTYDFGKEAQQKGDPNGGPLKDTTLIPGDEGQAPGKSIKVSDLLGNLGSVEGWSANSCGKSLNDDSWDTVEVVAPCAGTYDAYNRMAGVIKGQHKPNGTPPPTKQIGDSFWKAASSPAAQKNLDEQWYCRFYTHDASETALNNTVCKPYNMMLGDTNLVAAGMQSQACRTVSAPAFVPEIKTTLGGGILGCRKGLPEGSSATSEEEANYGAWVLGKSFPFLATKSAQSGPLHQKASQVSTNYFMGKSNCPHSDSQAAVAYDENCPAYKVHDGVSATFTVGPIPITVEAGAEGQIGIVQYARVAPMWANGRADPYLGVAGYASAYVNLVIAKGGVEANLTILNDTYDIYGFSGVAFLPKDSSHDAAFFFSEQLSGYDKINTLSGEIAAFAKIPVPKFLGWKWKKYKFTIFNWSGLTSEGYVFNEISGPTNIAGVK